MNLYSFNTKMLLHHLLWPIAMWLLRL